ncbi:MAG: electron transport complex subunit RsxC [Tissierellia bacterium]|nr:electron transport complex subunit RsxC [Tissierellia bacterium]
MANGNVTFKVGGVHMNEYKEATEKAPIEKLPAPQLVRIPMSQHIGAPCKPQVAVGDRVLKGQVIGSSDAFISAAIHSSVAGTVKSIVKDFAADGRYTDIIEIENDGTDELDPSIQPLANYETMSIDELMGHVKAAGIVGMGGAGFPLHAKLKNDQPPLDVVVLNGAECEPFLTCDHRMMVEEATSVIGSLDLFAKLYNTDEAYIAIEENKPDAVQVSQEYIQNMNPKLKVSVMKTKYPQGDSKRQSEAVVGRIVPPGGVTNNVGVFLTNIQTAVAFYDLVKTGMPSIERVLTVSGSGIQNPKNLLVPVGTRVQDILDFCGVKDGVVDIVCGGPMTGKSVFDTNAPITKTTSGILALTEEEIDTKATSSPCIQCDRCIDHCPANINPTRINAAIERGRIDVCTTFKADQCMECGICSFVCPAKRPLASSVKLAKREVMANKRK